MVDIMQPGLTEGNLAVTLGIVVILTLISEKFKVLDRLGIYAAAALGLIVGGLGHWTWLIILLGFLATAHKATKWRFDEKASKGLCESIDGHRSWGNVVANGGGTDSDKTEEIGRKLTDTISMVPAIDCMGADFDKMIYNNMQDLLMVSYLLKLTTEYIYLRKERTILKKIYLPCLIRQSLKVEFIFMLI